MSYELTVERIRDYFAGTAWANVPEALDGFVRGKEQPA